MSKDKTKWIIFKEYFDTVKTEVFWWMDNFENYKQNKEYKYPEISLFRNVLIGSNKKISSNHERWFKILEYDKDSEKPDLKVIVVYDTYLNPTLNMLRIKFLSVEIQFYQDNRVIIIFEGKTYEFLTDRNNLDTDGNMLMYQLSDSSSRYNFILKSIDRWNDHEQNV